MSECHFCGETFSDSEDLHMHWEDEHSDELNSHQRDEIKRTKNKRKNRQQQNGGGINLQQRKKYGGYALVALVALGLMVGVGQHIEFSASGPTGQVTADGDVDLDDRPFLGDEDADVTVIEFGDFLCPACGQFEQQIYPQLKSEYIETGEVKFYYLHLPVVDQHLSTQAGAAAECVAEQDDDAFFEFKNALFDHQDTASEQDWSSTGFYTSIAEQNTDIDTEEMATCIDSGATQSQVRSDAATAQDVGATATPTVLVDGQLIQDWQNFGEIERAIEAAQ